MLDYFRSFLTYSNLDYALSACLFFIAVCIITVVWTLYLIRRDKVRADAEKWVSFFELSLRRRGLD